MTSSLEDLLRIGAIAVNLGVQDFAENLQAQGAEVIHVDWSPPAGGDEEMAELLDTLL